MNGGDTKDGATLRGIAEELQALFYANPGGSIKTDKNKLEPKRDLPIVVNPPLDFELKKLDSKHPYLLNRGFTQETIDYFGVGFCSRGLLKDRIAIPLRSADSTLIGYAGRVVDDSLITEGNPRYRFPGARERDGNILEFRKTHFVYNGFRFKTPLDDAIVVEGFTSVWWIHQCGLPSVVGVMGSDCSEKQGELIVSLTKPEGRVWIMPDGNEAGERCALALFRHVSPYRFVRWIKLEKDQQPTDLAPESLKNCFTT